MVLLYKDPDGESVMGKTNSVEGRGTKLSTSKEDTDLKGKVTSLQKVVKEQEDTISELRRELRMKKVCKQLQDLSMSNFLLPYRLNDEQQNFA